MGPDAALAVSRFGTDAAAMILWGAFAFCRALVPPPLADATQRRLAVLRVAAIAVALAATVAALPLEAAAIADGWPDALDPATIRAVLLETSVGWAWMARAVAALLLAATLGLSPRRQGGATAGAAGLLLATLALTGHAAMQEGLLGAAHRLNDAVHLLAGGAWIGALVALLPVLRALDDPRHRRDAGIGLRRFSTVGHGVVALVLATGLVNTALVLGRWPTDWSSPYQAMLAIKVALVIVMSALALGNRYVLVPRLARTGSLGALRRATILEIGLGLLVVGLVGVFGLLEPV